MSTRKSIGASVRARLLNRAKDSGSDFGLILTKYALERILYRLSVSRWGDAFLLKGALLFDLWFDQPHRPTRDIDLLGFGPSDVDDVAAVFRDVCALACEDGMTFDAATVRAAKIRKEANYAGVRVTLLGILDGARCAVQIDVGYGDAITPEPERVSFPVLLEDMAAPVMRVYPAYTVVAEKYQAMVSLGMVNTRLKDYFDLWVLAKHVPFDPDILQEAITATFTRRGTPCRRNCRWVCPTHSRKTARKFSSGRLFSTRTSCRRRHWMNWSASYARCYGGRMLSEAVR